MCTHRIDRKNRHMNLYTMFHYHHIGVLYLTRVFRLPSRESIEHGIHELAVSILECGADIAKRRYTPGINRSSPNQRQQKGRNSRDRSSDPTIQSPLKPFISRTRDNLCRGLLAFALKLANSVGGLVWPVI